MDGVQLTLRFPQHSARHTRAGQQPEPTRALLLLNYSLCNSGNFRDFTHGRAGVGAGKGDDLRARPQRGSCGETTGRRKWETRAHSNYRVLNQQANQGPTVASSPPRGRRRAEVQGKKQLARACALVLGPKRSWPDPPPPQGRHPLAGFPTGRRLLQNLMTRCTSAFPPSFVSVGCELPSPRTVQASPLPPCRPHGLSGRPSAPEPLPASSRPGPQGGYVGLGATAPTRRPPWSSIWAPHCTSGHGQVTGDRGKNIQKIVREKTGLGVGDGAPPPERNKYSSLPGVGGKVGVLKPMREREGQ